MFYTELNFCILFPPVLSSSLEMGLQPRLVTIFSIPVSVQDARFTNSSTTAWYFLPLTAILHTIGGMC